MTTQERLNYLFRLVELPNTYIDKSGVFAEIFRLLEIPSTAAAKQGTAAKKVIPDSGPLFDGKNQW